MTDLKDVLWSQPYPCFKLIEVPEDLKQRLKKGMLCLYNIDQREFEFPTIGEIGPIDILFSYLDFIGYYSIEDFRELVFSGRLPVTCPSCKGPVEDAGMMSFEVEETGTVELDSISGDAEVYICKLCGRPFGLMPIS